jgi:hypothetical protein
MANTPSFIGTPRLSTVNVSTANTAIDGTGTITELIVGASTGTRVLEINAQATATTAAALVNIFITTDGGSTWRLFDQITISAATPSNTVKGNRNIATYANLVLPNANTRLGVTTSISQSTNVIALAGDL